MSDLSFAEVMRGVPEEQILNREERGRLATETTHLRSGEGREVVRLLRESYRWNSHVGIALTRQLGARDLDDKQRLAEEYTRLWRTLTAEDLARINAWVDAEGWTEVKEAMLRVGP